MSYLFCLLRFSIFLQCCDITLLQTVRRRSLPISLDAINFSRLAFGNSYEHGG